MGKSVAQHVCYSLSIFPGSPCVLEKIQRGSFQRGQRRVTQCAGLHKGESSKFLETIFRSPRRILNGNSLMSALVQRRTFGRILGPTLGRTLSASEGLLDKFVWFRSLASEVPRPRRVSEENLLYFR